MSQEKNDQTSKKGNQKTIVELPPELLEKIPDYVKNYNISIKKVNHLEKLEAKVWRVFPVLSLIISLLSIVISVLLKDNIIETWIIYVAIIVIIALIMAYIIYIQDYFVRRPPKDEYEYVISYTKHNPECSDLNNTEDEEN